MSFYIYNITPVEPICAEAWTLYGKRMALAEFKVNYYNIEAESFVMSL